MKKVELVKFSDGTYAMRRAIYNDEPLTWWDRLIGKKPREYDVDDYWYLGIRPDLDRSDRWYTHSYHFENCRGTKEAVLAAWSRYADPGEVDNG